MKLQFSDREGVFGRGEASQESQSPKLKDSPGMLRPYFVLRHAEIFPSKVRLEFHALSVAIHGFGVIRLNRRSNERIKYSTSIPIFIGAMHV
jgi:hypothetical protein